MSDDVFQKLVAHFSKKHPCEDPIFESFYEMAKKKVLEHRVMLALFEAHRRDTRNLGTFFSENVLKAMHYNEKCPQAVNAFCHLVTSEVFYGNSFGIGSNGIFTYLTFVPEGEKGLDPLYILDFINHMEFTLI